MAIQLTRNPAAAGANDWTNRFAADVNSLSGLRSQASRDPKAAMQGAAQQFESIFMSMMMKSMRQASPTSGVFDGPQTQMFQGYLDQQLGSTLSTGKGIGLAEMLMQQLEKINQNKVRPASLAGLGDAQSGERAAIPFGSAQLAKAYGLNKAAGVALDAAALRQNLPVTMDWSRVQRVAADVGRVAAVPGVDPSAGLVQRQRALQIGGGVARGVPTADLAPAAPTPLRPAASQTSGPNAFLEKVGEHATAAASLLGVSPSLVIAHAALETGWGRREIVAADGTNSHNLFGIKATGNWTGKTVDIMTTEYIKGVPQKRVETFRAYDSYAESFMDYAKLLANNGRYASALNQGDDAAGFAQALAKGGYATDPNYADKLTRVANSPRLRPGTASG